MSKVSNFDVLKVMSERNLKIKLSPLSNVVSAKANTHGGIIEIGVDSESAMDLLASNSVGGLIIADKEQFDLIKFELEAKNNEK